MTYTTVQGDCWDWIAKRVYGDETKLWDLMNANHDHIQTVVFDAGVVLTVPEETAPNTPEIVSSPPPWIGSDS